jgi:cytochrome c peroxidase
MGPTSVRDHVAGRRRAGLQHSGSATGQRSGARTPECDRSRSSRSNVRPNGTIDRRLRSLARSHRTVLAGKAQFTPEEQQGYNVFRGKGRCNECHRDGGPGEDPLFTDFTASNIGTPANPNLPYYSENLPDDRGYVANKDGSGFIDGGVGAFLSGGHPLSQPSSIDARWKSLASQNRGRFQVPTLRNVDKRPSPDFVKAYGHNGYFKSLKQIVHFYNTRDVLSRCAPLDPREGTGCWPAPETTENMNKSKTGNLSLTEQEEDALVAFMQTLTDGYVPTQE